jgi:hypothetical protein
VNGASDRASDPLRDHLAVRLSAPLSADPSLEALLDEVRRRFGDSLAAVLVYGSYLRGKRDTLVDLYALVDDYRALPKWQALLCRLLPPNVYHLAGGRGVDAPRAKCAVLSVERFHAATHSDFHSYFWARFAQPCRLLWCRDAAARERVVDSVAGAVRTFLRRVAPMLPAVVSTRDWWLTGFALTYACELRSERPGYVRSLVDADGAYYDTLLRLAPVTARPDPSAAAARAARWSWAARRIQGKWLSLARLLKAAPMFEAPLDYILWKIERHSGIHVEVSERQRRHPLLFAWPIFWRLYRQGAFR